MGNFTWEGWQTSAEDAPQPISILFGANLKTSSSKSSQQVESGPPSGSAPDFVVDLLKDAGLPLTRENYLGLAYPEGVPEDLDESSLPPEIRQA